MWTIVAFEDNTVEVVPHHWYKTSLGTCAWPKKSNTTKKKIEHRVQPNSFDFNYYKARILRTNIETMEIANKKLQQALDTSDLGTCDDEEDESKNNQRYSRRKKIMYSPEEAKIKNISSQSISKPPLFKNDELSLENQPNICNEKIMKTPDPLFNNGKIINAIKEADCPFLSSESEDDDTDKDKTYTPVEHSLIRKFETEKHINDNEIMNSSKKKKLDINAQQKLITNDECNFPLSQQKLSITIPESLNQNLRNSYTRSEKRQCIMGEEEFQDKMFRSIKKITYTLQGIEDKLDILGNKIETLNKNDQHSIEYYSNIDYETETNVAIWPIFTDDQLKHLEMKLENDFTFKMSMVKQLRSLNGKDVGDSVRRLMRCMFCDSFLEKYSYIGFKKKRSFSKLNCCRLIFDAVKADNKFKDVLDILVEKYIKSWLGQAPFRIKNIIMPDNRIIAEENIQTQ